MKGALLANGVAGYQQLILVPVSNYTKNLAIKYLLKSQYRHLAVSEAIIILNILCGSWHYKSKKGRETLPFVITRLSSKTIYRRKHGFPSARPDASTHPFRLNRQSGHISI